MGQPSFGEWRKVARGRARGCPFGYCNQSNGGKGWMRVDLGGLSGKFPLIYAPIQADYQCDPRRGIPISRLYEYGVSDTRPKPYFGGSYEPNLHHDFPNLCTYPSHAPGQC